MIRGALLALTGVLLAGCGGEHEEESPRSTAPADVKLTEVADVDGLAKLLEARRGQPLLLNLWAMWCAPCVEELPDLVEAARALRASGGELLGVALDLTAPGQTLDRVRERLPRFLAERGVDYPVVLFAGDDPFPIIQHFALQSGALPITIAIDRTGEIVAVHDGKAGPDELSALIDRVTAE